MAETYGRFGVGGSSHNLAGGGEDLILLKRFLVIHPTRVNKISAAVGKSSGSNASVAATITEDIDTNGVFASHIATTAYKVPSNESATYEDFVFEDAPTLEPGVYWFGVRGSYGGSGSAHVAYDNNYGTDDYTAYQTAWNDSDPIYDDYASSMYIQYDENLYNYYFDGSDAAASDPDSAWSNETNADDGDTTTFASNVSAGSESSNFIKIEGTDAPATGHTISSVRFRIYSENALFDGDSVSKVYTDSLAQDLGTVTHATGSGTDEWSSYTTLSTPTGGWTWAKVQALEFKVWTDNGGKFGRAEIEVTVESPSSEKTFAVAVDADDNYAINNAGGWTFTTGTDQLDQDTGASDSTFVFLRFDGVTIPQGQTLVGARLEVTAYDTTTHTLGGGGFYYVGPQVFGFQDIDPDIPTNDTEYDALTVNSTAISSELGNMSADNKYEIEITDIVQANIDDGSWSSGDALLLRLGSVSSFYGYDYQIYAHDEGGGDEAVLKLYTEGETLSTDEIDATFSGLSTENVTKGLKYEVNPLPDYSNTWNSNDIDVLGYLLDSDQDAVSMVMTPWVTESINTVYIFVDAIVGTPPTYRISIQGDSSGDPDGTELDGGSFTPITAGWQAVDLDGGNFTLTQGVKRHFVIEYDSGTINGSNYSQVEVTQEADSRFPRNNVEGGLQAVSTSNGGTNWVDDGYGPIIFFDGINGQPYNSFVRGRVYEQRYRGGRFTLDSDKTIDGIGMVVEKTGTIGDDLHYAIYDETDSVVRSGLFATEANVAVAPDRDWLYVSFSEYTITAGDEHRLVIYVENEGGDSSNYYDCFGWFVEDLNDTPPYSAAGTYGGIHAQFTLSGDTGSTWTDTYPMYDHTFALIDSTAITKSLAYSVSGDSVNVQKSLGYRIDNGDRYWVGNGGNFEDTSHWSLTSGGTGGASVPDISDETNAIFDANSFNTGSQTVTLNDTASPVDLDFLGVTNTPHINFNGEYFETYGTTVRFVSGMTFTSDAGIYIYSNNNGETIDFYTGDQTWSYVNINAFNTGVTFDLNGELNTNATDVYNGTVATYNTNNNDINCLGANADFYLNSDDTWNFGTSTVTVEGYLDLDWNGDDTDNLSATGATFNFQPLNSNDYFYVNNNQTVGTVNFLADCILYHDEGGTINNVSFAGGNTYRMEAPGTLNIGTGITFSGTSGNEVTLEKFGTGQYTFDLSSGTVVGDYVDATDSNVIGGARWYAGINFPAIDTQNNDGWIFPDSVTKSLEYTVVTPATEITKTLSYEILNTDAVTKSLQYVLAGLKDWTYEVMSSLNTDESDLANDYSAGDITDVSADDDDFKDLAGIGFLVEQVDILGANDTTNIDIAWKGKTTLAPSTSTVHLQVYNFDTTSWETLDSDSSTAADIEFSLSGYVDTDVENYYDASNYAYVRVYQENS